MFCTMCPRMCKIDRKEAIGFCGATDKISISRVGLHEWEEPCISYQKGSGTIFFTGCVLKCVYCQNHEISSGRKGKEISADTLEYEILKLASIGAVNINLVSPTQYALFLVPVLEKVKSKINIPIVYNTGGYENVETLKRLDGLVDIYLPDLKHFDENISLRYSGAKDYFEKTSLAIIEMHRQTGYAKLDEHGYMKKGVLVRHLVLPGLYKDTEKILLYLAKEYDVSKMALSLMSQYFPTHKANMYPEINRRITTLEYNKVVNLAKELGFVNGYIQKRSSAKKEYVPQFDY